MLDRILAVLLLSSAEIGYAQPVAEKPDYRPGDSWEFQAQDSKGGKPYVWTRTIEEVESSGRIAVKWQSGATHYYDSALDFQMWGRADWTRSLVRYPLRVGNDWTYSFTLTDPNWGELGHGKVVAYESIHVPAGTFQCYRVEAESTYGSKYYTEYWRYTRWYCPEIKWFAKQILTTRTWSVANPAANGEATHTSILVKFSAKP